MNAPGIAAIMIRGGRRGGIAVALVAPPPDRAGTLLLATATCFVAVFSIDVRALAIHRLARRFLVPAP